MRFVIYGAGAVGGTVGVRLHESGHEVALIARGAHHQAIADHGLRLLTPADSVTARLPVFTTAAQAQLREDDVVLLCVKGQDTPGALSSLRQAAPGGQIPVVTMQNGVENERTALRLFPDVYGCVVQTASEHLEPGLVVCYTGKVTGRLDLGRYPGGIDQRCEEICTALRASKFESDVRPDVMPYKYAKLISNLINGVQVVCGPGDPGEDSGAPQEPWARLVHLVREEGRAVLRAAGIDFDAPEVTDVKGRWERWGFGEVPGHEYSGGSTWQSVARGTGSVETDLLNGEIVLLGRQLGHPTPANELIQRLTYETVQREQKPGWRSAQDVLAELGKKD